MVVATVGFEPAPLLPPTKKSTASNHSAMRPLHLFLCLLYIVVTICLLIG